MNSADSSLKAQSTRAWDLWVGAIPLVAVAPMLVFRIAEIARFPEMRFFPIALLFLVVLIAVRKRRSTAAEWIVRMWWAVALFSVSALVYAYAVWTFSPWTAQVAAALLLVGWSIGRLGKLHWAGGFSLAAMLMFTLGLPVATQQLFSRWVCETAAWLCAKSLDALEIPNLLAGSLLELDGLVVLADRLCQGLDSVYAFLALVTAYLILSRRGLLVGLTAIITTPFWVMLGNYCLLLTICLVHTYQDRDLTSGWDYVGLRVAVDVTVLLFVFVFIRTVARFAEPVPATEPEFGPVFSALNKLQCWPQKDPFEELEPDDPDEARHYRRIQAQKAQLMEQRARVDWTVQPKMRWTVIASSLLFALAGIVPLALLASGRVLPAFAGTALSQAVDNQLNVLALPAVFNGWQLDAQSERPDRAEGISVRNWQYQSAGQTAFVSLEYPTSGWKSPVEVRTRYGWRVVASSFERPIADDLSNGTWLIYFAELQNALGGTAYVWASCLDAGVNPLRGMPKNASVEVTNGEDESPQNVLAIWKETTEESQQAEIILSLFSETGVPLSRTELISMQRDFEALRDGLLRASKTSGETTSQTIGSTPEE